MNRFRVSHPLKKAAVLGIGAAVGGLAWYKYHQWHLRYYTFFDTFCVCIVRNRSKANTDIHIIGLYEMTHNGLILLNNDRVGLQTYRTMVQGFIVLYSTDREQLTPIPAAEVQRSDCLLQQLQNAVRDELRENDNRQKAQDLALGSGLMQSYGQFQKDKNSWKLEYLTFSDQASDYTVCLVSGERQAHIIGVYLKGTDGHRIVNADTVGGNTYTKLRKLFCRMYTGRKVRHAINFQHWSIKHHQIVLERLRTFVGDWKGDTKLYAITSGLRQRDKKNTQVLSAQEADAVLPVRDTEDKAVDRAHEDMENSCNTIRGLRWTGNSCYMDSVLVSIFAVPGSIVADTILHGVIVNGTCETASLWKIRAELSTIRTKMRTETTDVSSFRSAIKACPVESKFHEMGTQEADDFLKYLFGLFTIVVATRRVCVSGRDAIETEWIPIMEDRMEVVSPIIDVNPSTLAEQDNDYDITKYIEMRESSTPVGWKAGFAYKLQTTTVIDSPFIIFNISRTQRDGQPLWKRIAAPETMTLKKVQLRLSAIVVHTGNNHYIAKFTCGDRWFHYDDRKTPAVVSIGLYKNMLESEHDPLTHGTLFFYTPA